MSNYLRGETRDGDRWNSDAFFTVNDGGPPPASEWLSFMDMVRAYKFNSSSLERALSERYRRLGESEEQSDFSVPAVGADFKGCQTSEKKQRRCPCLRCLF